MRKDSRLSRTLHVLLHMARLDHALTSEVIARMFDTNPVVVRRMMAGLRNRGYVRSENGRGGGWTIACDLDTVTLLDIHEALGKRKILSLGNDNDDPGMRDRADRERIARRRLYPGSSDSGGATPRRDARPARARLRREVSRVRLGRKQAGAGTVIEGSPAREVCSTAACP